MSENGRNKKSIFSSLINWGVIKKLFTIGAVLMIIYVIFIFLSPLFKLGRAVAGGWNALWNTVLKALTRLCNSPGQCVPTGDSPVKSCTTSDNCPSGFSCQEGWCMPAKVKTGTSGICQGNPETKDQPCTDPEDEPGQGQCGSKGDPWCGFIAIGALLLLIPGALPALFGWIWKLTKKTGEGIKWAGENAVEKISSLTGKSEVELTGEATDEVERFKEIDRAAVKQQMEQNYPRDKTTGKFTEAARKSLCNADICTDATVEAEYNKRLEGQYNRVEIRRATNKLYKIANEVKQPDPSVKADMEKYTAQMIENNIVNLKETYDENEGSDDATRDRKNIDDKLPDIDLPKVE